MKLLISFVVYLITTLRGGYASKLNFSLGPMCYIDAYCFIATKSIYSYQPLVINLFTHFFRELLTLYVSYTVNHLLLRPYKANRNCLVYPLVLIRWPPYKKLNIVLYVASFCCFIKQHPWTHNYLLFAVPWLNAQLTALSTSSVWIETLNNPHWELPSGNWHVSGDSGHSCAFPETAPLKGCLDSHAGPSTYYWIGNGKEARGNSINTLQQNRKCS